MTIPDRPALLERVTGPADVRALPPPLLPALAAEIREFLITKVSATGGHLGPSLGAVELTIALHRVFRSPHDALIFDIGHQAYVHKLLTGRRGGFDGLRQAGGLSGYLSRDESEHDLIENSHASTALSYADGLARATALGGHDRSVVAVIGDGALTGGMALEALHNIGGGDRPVIMVLNDNGRSYDPTVGGLAVHLAALRAGPTTVNLFTELGFAYLGPVDGHDVTAVEAALRSARELAGPVLVHVVTVKGKGCVAAETDEADRMHAIGVIDPVTGVPVAAGSPTWTEVFGEEIAELGAERTDLVCLTAAMLRPVGLARFAAKFPDRVIDVGIAEQHAVTCAAGLALGGLHPVVAIYATFLNRALDQVLMDVALHRLPVTFVLDRAGVTGPDGPSHHGMWDTSLLGIVPGLRLAAPRDPASLRALLREAVAVEDGPTAIRYPKHHAGPDIPAMARLDGIEVLHHTVSRPPDVLLVAAGPMAGPCLAAAAELEHAGRGVTVVDPRWIVPVNPSLVTMVARHRLAVTVEDNCRVRGMGTGLAQACRDRGVPTPLHNLGLPADFLPHGPRADLLAAAGLDAAGIARAVLACPAGSSPPAEDAFGYRATSPPSAADDAWLTPRGGFAP
jgi:1-deoxy-D-xylulose-5-phosphate synthase